MWFNVIFLHLQSTEYIQHTSLTGGSTRRAWLAGTPRTLYGSMTSLSVLFLLRLIICRVVLWMCFIWCFSVRFVLFFEDFCLQSLPFFREEWRDDIFCMIRGRHKFKAHPSMLKHGSKIWKKNTVFLFKKKHEKTLSHVCTKAQTEQNKSKATKLSTD